MTALHTFRARLPAWFGPAGVGVVVAAGALTLGLMDPETRASLMPSCPFRAATGLDCPGCGATRGLYALTQGDVLRAMDHNIFVVLILPVLLWAWFGWLRASLGLRDRAPTLRANVSMSLAVALTAFWVLRNVPIEPFSWFNSTVGPVIGGLGG